MEHIEFFLRYLQYEKRRSAHTVVSYRRDVNDFVLFCIEKYSLTSVTEVGLFCVRAWVIDLLQTQKITPRSVRRKIAALKSFFKFLIQRDIIKIDPTKKIALPKIGKPLPTFVPKQKIDLLFTDENFADDFIGLRDRTILEVLYATGMRRSELISLTLPDFSTAGKYFKVLGKGNKERLIPFAPHTKVVMEKYLAMRKETFVNIENNYIFVTKKGAPIYDKLVYNLVKKYLSLVSSAAKRSPHTLRHSFATHLTDNGADIKAVKELLGHASLAATQIYTHNSIEKLKKVYELAHPKAKK